MESPRRDLLKYMVEHRSILKNEKMRIPVQFSLLKQVSPPPKKRGYRCYWAGLDNEWWNQEIVKFTF